MENTIPPVPGHEPVAVRITVNDRETDTLRDVFLGPGQAPAPGEPGGVRYHALGLHGGLSLKLCQPAAQSRIA